MSANRIEKRFLDQPSSSDGFVGSITSYATIGTREVRIAECRIFKGVPPVIKLNVPNRVGASDLAKITGGLSDFMKAVESL